MMKPDSLSYRDFKLETKIVSVIFVASLLTGYLQAGNPPQIIVEMLNNLEDLARQVVEGDINLFSLIVINNVIAVVTIIIGGLLFGISPIVSSIANGYLIGVVGGQIIADGDWLLFLVGIMPHGIIEIPALIISLAVGLRLGIIVIKELFNSKLSNSFSARVKIKAKLMMSELSRSLSFCFKVIIPLVILAGVIEAFVTPILIELVI